MGNYILRRVLYSIPILICVNIVTFFLFFYVNTPNDVAHTILGDRYVTAEAIYTWKREHNYHLPLMLNLRDKIVYVTNKEGVIKDDIKEALKDYQISACPINEKEAVQSRGLNEIIIVDSAEIKEEDASRIVSRFLEKGVPFIVILRDGQEVKKEFDLPVITKHSISKEEDLIELKRFIDAQQAKGIERLTKTIFFNKSVRLFWFDFGKSDRENLDISYQVKSRMGASLMITVPAFILGLALNIFLAMIVAFCRGTYIDRIAIVVCILIMSVLSLFYYFSSQLFFGTYLKIFPVSGYIPGMGAIRFVLLPVLVTLIMGIGGGVRFYRTVFLEEIGKDYVRTARAKGLSELKVLFKHVLKNSMLPILTNSVTIIPLLFMGSLILESFFGIPGLGGFTLEGIQAQDFRIVGSMVYLGSFLYIVGLILTDISYTLVDPRIRFE